MFFYRLPDGGQAILAKLNQVDGMAIDANGLTYIADQNNNRIRTFTLPSIITGLLPVNLLNFRATVIGQDVTLQWSTSSEQHSGYFVIERSANGKENWQTAGALNAAGNSSVLKDYSFTDKNALSGTNYYRLKQVDVDQKATYSKTFVVSTQNSSNSALATYPNPVLDHVTVNLNSKSNAKGIIKIIDAFGAVQFQKAVNVQSGNNTFTINNLAHLKAGMYVLEVNIDSNNVTMVAKILKM